MDRGKSHVILPIKQFILCHYDLDLCTFASLDGAGVWRLSTIALVTITIRLLDWVAPGDTAIPDTSSLKDGDLQHSNALAQSPNEI